MFVKYYTCFIQNVFISYGEEKRRNEKGREEKRREEKKREEKGREEKRRKEKGSESATFQHF